MRFSLILEVCVNLNWMNHAVFVALVDVCWRVELPTLSSPLLSGAAAEAAASLQEVVSPLRNILFMWSYTHRNSCCFPGTPRNQRGPLSQEIMMRPVCSLWFLASFSFKSSFKIAQHTKSVIEWTQAAGKLTLPCCCLNTAKISANVDKAFIRRTQKPQQTRRSCCVSRWRLTRSPGSLRPVSQPGGIRNNQRWKHLCHG